MTGREEDSMDTQVFTGGRIFTADTRPWASALVVRGERLLYVGDDDTARRIAGADAPATDLAGALVLPGFVDGHAHVVDTGRAADQIDLWGADTLDEVQRRISAGAAADAASPRLRAQGFQHAAMGARPHRRLLDEIVADRPLYVQAHDMHSILLSTAALRELGIDTDTVAPAGGAIHRDADGQPTGLIDETAMQQLVWPRLDEFTTDADTDRAVAAALRGYRESGVTATTDMALDAGQLAALRRAEAAGELTTRIAGYWIVNPTGSRADDLAQVARVAQLAAAGGDRLCVVGVKIMVDGTVDGYTAALGRPYANGALPAPVWDLEALAPVVAAADAAGLLVAMHAIGDEAIRIALSAVEHAIAVGAPRARRHRIEHLEVAGPAEIERLAALGITASMQPVHSDPAIQDNWRAMLGDERVERGYPWPEMTDAGARLAFGTDSPTSPYAPLPNMFIAATRRSALVPGLEPNVERYALPLADAIVHATADAAWACGAEGRYGRLAAGLFADFVVLDRDVFALPADELLAARIVRTVVGGETVFAGPRCRDQSLAATTVN